MHTEKSGLDPYHFSDTKVKVEISLEAPPPEIVEVRNTIGNFVRIQVQYLRLPPKCCNCGNYGQFFHRCPKPTHRKKAPFASSKGKVFVDKVSTKTLLQPQVHEQSTQDNTKKAKSNYKAPNKNINRRAISRSREKSKPSQ